ncbi:Hypothetical predicted protein [Mytilus galloprovincialis]|uniref:Uncharacterized protein n=1 Tax=Mytilus galloprovincialis TaxID=29158 RepID=A0A8B6F386_MYTGA|nr:Hypothetical predicted protein [Mytilus galloprovincialis]
MKRGDIIFIETKGIVSICSNAQPYYSYQLRRKLIKIKREMRHKRTFPPKQNGEAITSRWLGYYIQDLDIPAFGNTCPLIGTTVPIIGSTLPVLGSILPVLGSTLPVLGSTIPIREIIDGDVSIRLGHTLPF